MYFFFAASAILHWASRGCWRDTAGGRLFSGVLVCCGGSCSCCKILGHLVVLCSSCGTSACTPSSSSESWSWLSKMFLWTSRHGYWGPQASHHFCQWAGSRGSDFLCSLACQTWLPAPKWVISCLFVVQLCLGSPANFATTILSLVRVEYQKVCSFLVYSPLALECSLEFSLLLLSYYS